MTTPVPGTRLLTASRGPHPVELPRRAPCPPPVRVPPAPVRPSGCPLVPLSARLRLPAHPGQALLSRGSDPCDVSARSRRPPLAREPAALPCPHSLGPPVAAREPHLRASVPPRPRRRRHTRGQLGDKIGRAHV